MSAALILAVKGWEPPLSAVTDNAVLVKDDVPKCEVCIKYGKANAPRHECADEKQVPMSTVTDNAVLVKDAEMSGFEQAMFWRNEIARQIKEQKLNDSQARELASRMRKFQQDKNK